MCKKQHDLPSLINMFPTFQGSSNGWYDLNFDIRHNNYEKRLVKYYSKTPVQYIKKVQIKFQRWKKECILTASISIWTSASGIWWPNLCRPSFSSSKLSIWSLFRSIFSNMSFMSAASSTERCSAMTCIKTCDEVQSKFENERLLFDVKSDRNIP